MKPVRLQWPTHPARALQTWALIQLAVAYPVYALLLRFPEFFVARPDGAVDIWRLAMLLSLALPLAWALLARLLSSLHRVLGLAFHLASLLVLFTLLGLSLPGAHASAWLQPVLSVLFAFAMVLAGVASRAGRLFLQFLAPAVLIVPGMFLLDPGIRSQWLEEHPGRAPEVVRAAPVPQTGPESPPVVMVVFDELPTAALLDADGAIRAGLFPNFHALAGSAHWFPHATTVATSTAMAVPGILTGRYPTEFRLPHRGQYRRNMFTWLGRSHALKVEETITAMCPRRHCRRPARSGPRASSWARIATDAAAVYFSIVGRDVAPGRAPDVGQAWSGFWANPAGSPGIYGHRLAAMDEFIARIQAGDGPPGLWFLHANFPHVAYEYLPSGRRYQEGWLMPGLDTGARTWTSEVWQTTRAEQRFLLQLQATDAWLGRLLGRLREQGLYDQAVIIITADHGVGFTPGWSRRDTPPTDNLDRNILPVPLIIKAPGQQLGRVHAGNAETIDILPTLAGLLGRVLQWNTDGVDLLGTGRRDANKRAVYRYKDAAPHHTDLEHIAGALREAARSSPFAGADSTQELFQLGPRPELLGQAATDLDRARDESLRLRLHHPEWFANVDPASGFIPAHVNGELEWPGHPAPQVAIAVNGEIVAVTQTWQQGGQRAFSAVAPERAFRPGANAVRVFALDPGDPATLVEGRRHGPAQAWAWNPGRSALTRGERDMSRDRDGIQGQLDYLSDTGDALEIMGWVIDAAGPRAVERVLVFDGEHLVYSGGTPMLRGEVHRYGVLVNIGFQAVIPRDYRAGPAADRLAVLAVTADGRFRRLETPR